MRNRLRSGRRNSFDGYIQRFLLRMIQRISVERGPQSKCTRLTNVISLLLAADQYRQIKQLTNYLFSFHSSLIM